TSGVFKTVNSGNSWSGVNGGLNASIVNALILDPKNSTTLYAGTAAGIFKSTNGANSWVASGADLLPNVFALGIDPITPTTVYAGTTGAVLKSTNSGASWVAVNIGA